MSAPEEIQRMYYSKTAPKYDFTHGREGEHARALAQIKEISKAYNLKTFLDVGCGTGRGVEFLLENGFVAKGIDVSQELLNQGVLRNPILADHVSPGNAYQLPYKENSFDAVCALGVMHHVKDPGRIIREMLRVARSAIFLSDSNRFGQGTKGVRYTKLVLWKLKLWPLANYIKTRGKGYHVSEGDGLFYSYSVYDSYHLIEAYVQKIIEIGTDKEWKSRASSPLLSSSHVLLAGLKKPVILR